MDASAFTLRPFRRSDLDDFAAFWAHPEVLKYMPWKLGDELTVKKALIDRILARDLDKPGDCLWNAITTGEQVVGEIMLHWRLSGVGEVGCSVHPDFHGRGWANEATRRMFDIGFDGGIKQICAATDPRNQNAARVLARLGMQRATDVIEPEWEGMHVYEIDRESFLLERGHVQHR